MDTPMVVFAGPECPHCKKPLQVYSVAAYNATAYRQPVRARAVCCGELVMLRPVVTVHSSKYNGDEKYDAWGR